MKSNVKVRGAPPPPPPARARRPARRVTSTKLRGGASPSPPCWAAVPTTAQRPAPATPLPQAEDRQPWHRRPHHHRSRQLQRQRAREGRSLLARTEAQALPLDERREGEPRRQQRNGGSG